MSTELESDTSSRIEEVVRTVSRWPGVALVPGNRGGRAIRLGPREVGLVRYAGTVTITFPVALQEALVEAGWTGPDPLAPTSGRTVFRVRTAGDIERALSLLRVSYLYHAADRSDTRAGATALATVDLEEELARLAPPRAVRQRLRAVAERAGVRA
jgi:hypothetical protein